MYIKRILRLLIIAAAAAIIMPASSYAALSLEPDALRALEYQEAATREINMLVDFYSICMRIIGPNPLTANSIVRGKAGATRYTETFEKLASSRKKLSKKDVELWEDMLDANERNNIQYFEKAVRDGAHTFWQSWPTMRVPGGVPDEKYSALPTDIKYIIPSSSGVVITSPTKLNKDLRQYLKQSVMFYPIVTLTIPVPGHMRNNLHIEAVLGNICRSVPGSFMTNDYKNIKVVIFPELDSMHELIGRVRQAMLDDNSDSNESGAGGAAGQ